MVLLTATAMVEGLVAITGLIITMAATELPIIRGSVMVAVLIIQVQTAAATITA